LVGLGRITRSQGNRGELRLRLYSDEPIEPFFQKVYLQSKGESEEFEVESVRRYKDEYVVKLKGIDTLEAARSKRGSEVVVPQEWLKPLAQGDYYLYQIIGCAVYTTTRQFVGEAEDVLSIENNDLLVVRDASREVLVPFTERICVEIDLKKREIVLEPPEGLLELNEI
jgi:16S rRNA processing protein RimM